MFNNFLVNTTTKYNLRLFPQFNQLQSIKFLDGERGFAVGQNLDSTKTYFIKTNNSGITWSDPVVVSGISFVNEVNFLNDSLGFTCGQDNSFPVISRTLDGGNTWSLNRFTSGVTPFIYHISFNKNNTIGIGTGIASNQGIVTRTTNSGNTWSSTSAITGVRELRTAQYISGNTFVAVGRNNSLLGIVVRSVDSGNTWNVLKTFTNAEARRLIDLQFINENVGFTVGLNGSSLFNGSATFFKTTNGGTTWSPVKIISGMSSAWGVNFSDENNGIIVGWNSLSVGMVATTNDGGNNWDVMELRQTNYLYYPTSVNGKFWFVGENEIQGFAIYKNG